MFSSKRQVLLTQILLALLLAQFTRIQAWILPSLGNERDIHRPRSNLFLDATPLTSDSDWDNNSDNDRQTQTTRLHDATNHVRQQWEAMSQSDVHQTLLQLGNHYQRQLKSTSTNNDSENAVFWQPYNSQILNTNSVVASTVHKVPGCVANVHVQSIVQFSDNNCVISEIRGTSDALVSRGLVALVAQVLQGQTVPTVLALNEEELTDHLGLRTILSRGRNDGVASLVRTIQHQVQQTIALVQDPSSNTTNSATSTSDSASESSSTSQRPRVALLLSGGVDSSVALRLLQRQNYLVTAFYLKIWLEDELAHLGQCPWEDDFQTCQAVCEQANVPLETISLQQEYKERVISYTLQEARQGRTPNPDILCNSRIKFGCFYDAIASRDFDYVASGHYAQLIRDEDRTAPVRLVRAPDPVKDQSYFLCALTQEQLQRVLFPIGHLEKKQVRELAEEFQLPNRQRPDSQGLCFLGKVKFDEFLSAYLGERPGNIVDAATGDVLGQHRGVWYHTVGQRKGIGLFLDPIATSRGPWYVVAKDPENDLVLVSNEYDEEIFTAARSQIAVEDIQWICGSPPGTSSDENSNSFRLSMKIRHGPKIVQGVLTLNEDGVSGDVKLDQKDGGLAPGQYIVFYEDEECLGGGVISEKHWAKFLSARGKVQTTKGPARNSTIVNTT